MLMNHVKCRIAVFLAITLCTGAAVQPNIIVNLMDDQDKESIGTYGSYDWPLFIYNFGGLDAYSIENQVNMLHGYGYAGMTLNVEKAEKLSEFDHYVAAASKLDGFKIYSVFCRFSYDERAAEAALSNY